jgi:SET domain-containing protein
MLEIRPAGTKGRGVFARQPIAAGQRILALGGRLLMTDQLTHDLLAMQVGDNLWLCSDGALVDDMINHSCEPNAGFTDGEPVLYALRDIAANEEISWDYSTSIAEAGWSMDCRCGSIGCRGVVRPWGELSAADRERLRGVVMKYLRDR